MRPAALAYVNNLTSLVYHLLDENDRYWHNDLIPYNEVWIKIGGDKGGTSFKASFQLVNTNKPNSVTNTCVFTVFEAGDSISNLHIALSRYSSEIETLSLSYY